MVRPLVATALLAALLSGCSASPAPDPASSVPDPWVTPPPEVLVEGTYAWHKVEATIQGTTEATRLFFQASAHPCLWDGPDGEEPYFTNFELPVRSPDLPAWSGNLTLDATWTDADWVGTDLRLAYQAPGLQGWDQTGPVRRGETFTLPIHPRLNNGTIDEDAATGWSLWLCLPTDTLSPEEPFVGSMDVRATFAPDPMPQSLLDHAAGDGRTARDG